MSTPEQTTEMPETIEMNGAEYEAHTIGVADDDIDPLQAVLISTATDDHGLPVSVYLALSPQVIVNLSAELHQVLRAQRMALGFDPDALGGKLTPTTETDQDETDEDKDEEEDDAPRDALLRRAGDPAGLRYLRDRAQQNPRVNLYIAAAVVALLVLFLTLKLIGR
ncbi:MAG: hypothetical protein ACR2P2_11770 [Nakamurella sp.]